MTSFPSSCIFIFWLNRPAQKMADICGYELPTNLQNFTQKELTEVKIFQKVLGGYFFETPYTVCDSLEYMYVLKMYDLVCIPCSKNPFDYFA